jgi:hypothetical protein
MKEAWLILLFSGWRVKMFKLETSEGKMTLVRKTDMNVRRSRFTASSEI